MNILITAVSGFLGSNLAMGLAKVNHCIIGTVRNASKTPSELNIEFAQYTLGDTLDNDLLGKQDVVIHCAHDFTDDSEAAFRLNVEGTQLLYQQAEDAGVIQQIFISSYSAHQSASSDYGKIKYQIEQFFLFKNQTIVRPGLVIGNGGLFLRNLKKILSIPVIPLMDKGQETIAVIGIDDFVAAVLVLVNDSIAGEFNLFNPELVSMKKFIRKINQLGKHKSLYINIPSSLAINTLIFLNKLGVKLPVNIENIKGLKNNAKCDYQSHLNQLLRQTSSLESMLSKVIDAQ